MGTFGKKLGAGWRRFEDGWFGAVDARVYALLRIAFAIVALLNLIDLWPHRAMFFSDAGMIDGAAMMAEENGQLRFSVFNDLDSPGAVTWVFVIAALAMVCLGLGIWSRVMIILVFVWQLSYTYRAFPVIHGWDILLRIQAFILLFSPLGPSLMALLKRGAGGAIRRSESLVPRYGLILIQIQLAVVYWQTLWLKEVDGSWRNGEFISYFMLSVYSRFPSIAWARWEMASALLTYGTLIIELALPLLLWNRRTRWLGFAAGFALHFGILVTSKIWLFSLVVLVPYLAFLDGKDLDRLAARFRGKAKSASSELL